MKEQIATWLAGIAIVVYAVVQMGCGLAAAEESATAEFTYDAAAEWITTDTLTMTTGPLDEWFTLQDGESLFASVNSAEKTIRVLTTSGWDVEYVGSVDELDDVEKGEVAK